MCPTLSLGSIFFNPNVRFEKHKYILLEDNIPKGVKLKPSWKNVGCQLSGVVGHVLLFYFIFNEWRFDFSSLRPGCSFSDAEHTRYALQMCAAKAYDYIVGGEWFMSLEIHEF